MGHRTFFNAKAPEPPSLNLTCNELNTKFSNLEIGIGQGHC